MQVKRLTGMDRDWGRPCQECPSRKAVVRLELGNTEKAVRLCLPCLEQLQVTSKEARASFWGSTSTLGEGEGTGTLSASSLTKELESMLFKMQMPQQQREDPAQQQREDPIFPHPRGSMDRDSSKYHPRGAYWRCLRTACRTLNYKDTVCRGCRERYVPWNGCSTNSPEDSGEAYAARIQYYTRRELEAELR